MEIIFNSRDLSLQEYSKKFEYFKEKFKIFEGLKKFQKIGKISLSQKENEKKTEVEETLEKKNEEKVNNKLNTSRIEVGEPKTDNENKKKTNLIEEIQEEVDDNEKNVDEKNMYNSEDSDTDADCEDNKGNNDNASDDNTGDDNTGDDNTCDDNTGDDNTGDDNTGDDNTGDDKEIIVYCVYEAGFTQKLSRWWWSENREKTFKYLDSDFNEFVDFLDNIKLHTTSINYIYFSKLIKRICLYCNKIIPGLYNLKETYENITKMKAKIDSIIMILIDFKAEMAILRKRQKAIYSKINRH